MHFPTNRGLKILAALIVLGVGYKVALQLKRPGGGMAQVGMHLPPESPVGPVVKKSELGWADPLYTYQGKPFTGVADDYYKNGQKRLKWPIVGGLWEGLLEEYAENGTRIVAKWYLGGKRHGETRYWSPSGQLTSIKMYENDQETAHVDYDEAGKPKP